MRKCSIVVGLLVVTLTLLLNPYYLQKVNAQNERVYIKGSVSDPQGKFLSGASITILDDKQILTGSATSDENGIFEIKDLPVGSYEVVVEKSGFALYRKAVRILKNSENQQLAITLGILPISEGVTVTAIVNEVQDIFDSSQQIDIITRAELEQRPGAILPQLFQEEVGISLQQETGNQASIRVRGLTSQRVVTLVDGIRFNNSIFQGGPDQYTALLDSSITSRIEIVHGPGSSQYGSDSLGGTINLLSQSPRFTTGGFEVHGKISTFFSSADLSAGGNFDLGLGNERINLVLGGFGRRVNDLRPGGGIDSHSAVTRFFGVSSQILGDRLQDTGFTQYGGYAKILWKPATDQQLTLFYNRSDQRRGRRYVLLNGGFFSETAEFSPHVLDFFYTRYEKQDVGPLDSLSGSFSFNRQHTVARLQINSFFPRTDEEDRVDSYGYLLQGTAHIGSYQFLTFGVELYDDHVDNRTELSIPFPPPATSFRIRGTVPNGSRFRSFGAYLQETADIIPGRWTFNGGVRYSAFLFKSSAKDNPIFDGRPTVLESSTRTNNVTFNTGTSFFINENIALTANISRGFRAPNVADLGTFGITAFGFEVSTAGAAEAGGIIGSTSTADARSTGKPVRLIRPETMVNYETGFKIRNRRFYSTVSFFNANLNDFITKRTLILPPGATGKQLDGLPITGQTPNGVPLIFFSPAVVTVNANDIRIYGLEATAQINLMDGLKLSGNFSYLRGKDKDFIPAPPSLPGFLGSPTPGAPDVPGGLPPAKGFISLRYNPPGKRFWLETYSHMASYQDRLSSIDFQDVNIAGVRNRLSIDGTFNFSARDRGLIGNGADSIPFTPDDVLLITGETLSQIQDRVLGPGVFSAPFKTATPGYATLNFRGGFQLGEHSNVTLILENILDKNYRTHGSGIDAPGINLVIRYSWQF
jgi:hemoglobin/transferrin/lactoferrin receptor protein